MALGAVSRELQAWSSIGAAPKLWWRDDDACHDSDPLQGLCRLLSTGTLLLAVVPGLLTEDLVRALEHHPAIGVAQHGWKHINHAAPGRWPSEYPPERARADIVQELAAGQAILREAFPASFHRVFVPPWHHCAAWMLRETMSLGYGSISAGPPLFPLLRQGYTGEANTEIDICDWARGGSFVGAGGFAAQIVKALRFRRESFIPDAPVGILSHHEHITKEDYACLAEFIALLRDSSAQWASLQSLFPECAP